MIIAFPVDYYEELESRLAEDFGEADSFLIYNSETTEIENVSHSGGRDNADSSRKAAQLISEYDVEVVIVNIIGCAAVNRLRGLGITAYEAQSDTVSENLASFESHELKPINAGDCDGSCR